MLKKYKEIVTQDAYAIIHFSDVFSPPIRDFDAELTTIIRNFGVLSDQTYYVGGSARLAGYGALLLHDLVEERKKISKEVDLADPYMATTLFGVLNVSPREGYDIETAPNGRDFHVAVTSAGVCFFSVPLETLSALETRNEILALYRIPNEHLPFTDGSREQFRSSIVALSRFQSEVFETVYEYKNVDEVIQAKKKGNHPGIIREQEREIEYAFADRFGNIRLSILENDAFRKKLQDSKGKQVRITIDQSGYVDALYVDSLSDIPLGALGLYENVADPEKEYRRAGYWELVKRSDHCLDDEEMALDILEGRSDDLDRAVFEFSVEEGVE